MPIIPQNNGFVHIISDFYAEFTGYLTIFRQKIKKMRTFAPSVIYTTRTKKLLLFFDSCEALAAVYRSVAGGLERNLSFLAASSANGGEHLTLSLGCVLACITACLASLGLVLEALLCVEFLLACGEYELVAALFARQCLVLKHFNNLA